MSGRAAVAILCLASVLAPAGLAARDTVLVKSIAVSGLRYRSAEELLRNVRTRTAPAGILVDLVSLKKALAVASWIEDFAVERKGKVLAVRVREKEPRALIMIRKGTQLVPLELGRDGSVLSLGSAYATHLPLLFAGTNDFRTGKPGPRVLRLLELLDAVKSGMPRLYRELEEIHFAGTGLRVLLRGRRTDFFLDGSLPGFAGMQYAAGFFDGAGSYPGSLRIGRRMAYR